MGSSVFHAAFSSFLALIPLAFAESFHFRVFFKTWTGITVFGFVNGLFLLPALMSEIGPLTDRSSDDSSSESMKEKKDESEDKESAANELRLVAQATTNERESRNEDSSQKS